MPTKNEPHKMEITGREKRAAQGHKYLETITKKLDTCHRATYCPVHSHSAHNVPNSLGLGLVWASPGGQSWEIQQWELLTLSPKRASNSPHLSTAKSKLQPSDLTLVIYHLKMWMLSPYLQKLYSTILGCELSMCYFRCPIRLRTAALD